MSESVADRVECYSGYTHAQEPRVVVWRGHRFSVAQVEHRWRTPQGPAFIVETEGDSRFELHYSEQEDTWMIQPLGDPDFDALKPKDRDKDGFEGNQRNPGNSKPVSP